MLWFSWKGKTFITFLSRKYHGREEYQQGCCLFKKNILMNNRKGNQAAPFEYLYGLILAQIFNAVHRFNGAFAIGKS